MRRAHAFSLHREKMAAVLELHASPRVHGSSFSLVLPRRFRSSISCCSNDVAVRPLVLTDAEQRSVVRLGLPSKGRMAEETLDLLKVPFFFCLLLSLWLLFFPLIYLFFLSFFL